MIKIVLIIGLFYLLATLFLYVKQRDLMYFPTPEVQADADILWLRTATEKIKIWVLKNTTQDDSPAIIYFGGNAEGVENNISDYRRLFPGYTVYISNYRGFGGSSGIATQQNLFHDALFIYDHVKNRHTSINIIGRSLGSGVACYVAAERPVEKLALITPYDSIKNVAQSAYPIFPVRWLLKDTYESIKYTPSIRSEVLIQIARNDPVVPNKGSENLAKAFQKINPRIEWYDHVTHAGISDDASYKQHLSEFFSI